MDKALFSLVFAYYLYTIGILFYAFKQRKKAFTRGDVDRDYFKNYISAGTEELTVLQNHFNNQFQIPVFFFITCIVAKLFNTINEITLILALLFILSRLHHSYIHLTHNHVLKRARSYFIGIIILSLMWVQILMTG